jgi:hypothetical protein
MLLALAMGAGVLAVMKLAAWWVIVPPSVMLIAYLGLLREASRADAERRWTSVPEVSSGSSGSSGSGQQARASASRAPAAPVTASAPVAPVAPPPDAEIIDITDRVSDELYDQISDAKLRAVGD